MLRHRAILAAIMLVTAACADTAPTGLVTTVPDPGADPQPPAPSAIVVTPARPVVGEVTTFEADGAIAGAGDTYTWDFGDGTVGDGATTQHVFASAGPYRVSLRVLSGGVEIHASGLDLDVAHATVAEARAAR